MDKDGKISFFGWSRGNLLRTGMLPAAPARHGSYNMDFWKSEQGAMLIFQEEWTIQAPDMQEHSVLVGNDLLDDLMLDLFR